MKILYKILILSIEFNILALINCANNINYLILKIINGVENRRNIKTTS